MTSATLSSSPHSISIQPGNDDTPRATSACAAVLQSAHQALARHLAESNSAATLPALTNALRVASAAVATLNRTQPKVPEVSQALAIIRELIAADLHPRLAAAIPQTAPSAKGWPGLLAMMLLHPAWHCSSAPTLDTVPEWLGEVYASWLFAVPQNFAAAGQAAAFLAHTERHLESLARWTEMNPGSSVVKTALDRYHSGSHFARLKLACADLRRVSELHGRLLTRLVRKPGSDPVLAAFSREGRRLRVGFVAPSFDDNVQTWAALALFTELDRERFDTVVYVVKTTDSRLEQHARQSAGEFQVLPADLADQVPMLATAGLDALVFLDEITGSTADVARLATHRLAPLQIATSAHHDVTTGLNTIDLFVTDARARDVSHQFTERLGLVNGPSRAFERLDPSQGPDTVATRSELGLPESGTLFVTAADWNQISPETQDRWAQVLKQVPGSYLLIQRTVRDETSADDPAAFAANFDRVLHTHGVTDDRLIISATALPSHDELQRLLAAGDVYLDTVPSADDYVALLALRAGLPVVTLAGDTLRTRRVASLLDSLSATDLVAHDTAGYVALAARLAGDADHRAALREQLRARATALPRALDALATADAFGDLLETAHDALESAGLARFRNNREPLVVATDAGDPAQHLAAGQDALVAGDFLAAATSARLVLRAQPNHAAARALLGRALLSVGQAKRAVDYLLASIEAADADATRWFDLARALQQNGQHADSIQALETSLRLDGKRADAWLMLIELAESSGVTDLAREAFETLRGIEPDHPELANIAARLGC